MNIKDKISEYFGTSPGILVNITNLKLLDILNNLVQNGCFEIDNEPTDLDSNDLSLIYYFFGKYSGMNSEKEKSLVYYKKSCDLGYNRAMHRLATHYKLIEDFTNMEKYYKLAINHKNSEAAISYAKYLFSKNSIDEAINYFNISFELGNIRAFYRLGTLFKSINDVINMLKYLTISTEQGNSNSMNLLGIFYEENGDYDNMFKFYNMAINLKHRSATYNLGHYYQNIEDFSMMVYYYNLALDLGDTDAGLFLIKFYEDIDEDEEEIDYKNLIECYYKMIKLGITKYIKKLNAILHQNFNLIDGIKYYNLLDHCNLNKLNKMTSSYFIIKNHLEQNPNLENTLYKSNECFICYEFQPVVFMKCTHYVCFECYSNIIKCPFCRDLIK